MTDEAGEEIERRKRIEIVQGAKGIESEVDVGCARFVRAVRGS